MLLILFLAVFAITSCWRASAEPISKAFPPAHDLSVRATAVYEVRCDWYLQTISSNPKHDTYMFNYNEENALEANDNTLTIDHCLNHCHCKGPQMTCERLGRDVGGPCGSGEVKDRCHNLPEHKHRDSEGRWDVNGGCVCVPKGDGRTA